MILKRFLLLINTNFWKDKEILKQQIKLWNSNNLRYLIIKVNKIELIVKKNPSISTFLVTDFLLDNAIKINNNS